MIASFHRFLAFLVFGGMSFSVFDHLFYFIFAQATGRCNLYRLLFSSAQILCCDMDNTVGIDVEGHLNLRHAAWRRGNTYKVKLAKQLVIRCHLSFALKDPYGNRGLVVLSG